MRPYAVIALVVLSLLSATAVDAEAFIIGGMKAFQEWLLGPIPPKKELRRTWASPECQQEIREWQDQNAARRHIRRHWYTDPKYAHPEGKHEGHVEKFRRVVRELSPCRRAHALLGFGPLRYADEKRSMRHR